MLLYRTCRDPSTQVPLVSTHRYYLRLGPASLNMDDIEEYYSSAAVVD